MGGGSALNSNPRSAALSQKAGSVANSESKVWNKHWSQNKVDPTIEATPAERQIMGMSQNKATEFDQTPERHNFAGAGGAAAAAGAEGQPTNTVGAVGTAMPVADSGVDLNDPSRIVTYGGGPYGSQPAGQVQSCGYNEPYYIVDYSGTGAGVFFFLFFFRWACVVFVVGIFWNMLFLLFSFCGDGSFRRAIFMKL